MTTAKELTDTINSLGYPMTQHYDAATLAPTNDITRRRIEHLKRSVPELFRQHDSLLDIGTCKGYMPHLLAKNYSSITGYEPNPEYFNLCNDVKTCRQADNIEFVNRPFQGIPLGRPTGEWALKKYDVVFVGNVHHYFFMQCYDAGVQWLWAKKLVALTGKYLIIDGPFEMDDKAAVVPIADRQKWPQEIRNQYTFNCLDNMLKPQFKLRRGPMVNEGGVRQTAIWERVAPDMEHVEISEEEWNKIIASGEVQKCSPGRLAGSVVKVGSSRYKYNPDCQDDGVFMIMNALPQFFPHRHFVMTRNGQRIGECCEWVDGIKPKSTVEIIPAFLRLNAALQSVGLVDLQLRLDDYAYRGKGLLSLDTDMMGPFDELKNNASGVFPDYIEYWINQVSKTVVEEIREIGNRCRFGGGLPFHELVNV